MIGASPHSWTLFFFGNNRSNSTIIMGGNVARKLVFWLFIQPVWGFLRKKFESRIQYPISRRKGYIHFCIIPWKMAVPPKIVFCGCFGKYCYFWKNCYVKNIRNLISYKKVSRCGVWQSRSEACVASMGGAFFEELGPHSAAKPRIKVEHLHFRMYVYWILQ